MQSKSLWIGLGILLAVVIVGVYLLFGRSLQTQSVPPRESRVEEKIVPPALQETEGEIREIIVEGDEYSFSPASISVSKGEKIMLTFKNRGQLPHNFTVEELGMATKTILAGQSDTIEFTAQDSGIFTSFCSVGNHRQLGMEGELAVE